MSAAGSAISYALKFATSAEGMAVTTAIGGIGAVKESPNKGLAVAKVAAEVALWTFASPVAFTLMAGEMLYTAGSITNMLYKQNSQYLRTMRTPFSHSFSHTDATFQAQQRGLQAIGRQRGMLGAEAGMMNELYGRR